MHRYTILAALFLAGCGHMVTSENVDGPIYESKRGLAYYLPKRIHSIKIKLTPKTIDEIEKKLIEAIDEYTDAKAVSDLATKAANNAKAECENQEKFLKELKDPNEKTKQEAIRDNLCAKSRIVETQEKAKNETAEIKRQSLDVLYGLKYQPTNDCVRNVTITISDKGLVADENYIFVADLNHNILHDDELKLTTTNSGLLTGSTGTSTDRTGDIIVEIAKAITVLGGAPGISLQSFEKGIIPKKPCTEEVFEFTADLSKKEDDVKKINDILNVYNLQMDVKGFTGYVNLDKPVLTRDNKIVGLFYRRELPYIVKITNKTDKSLKATALITMPNKSHIAQIPLLSGGLVKTVNDIKFDNGMLTEWNINRPSEVLALVKLPLEVFRSSISALSEIIKLRIDLAQQETSLTSAQTKQLDELEKLRTALEEATSNKEE